MLRGRWLSEEHLQSMLASLLESHKPGLVERLWPLLLVGAAAYLLVRRFVSLPSSVTDRNRTTASFEDTGQAGSQSRATDSIATMSGGNYEIMVAGHLDEHWSEWLGGLVIDHDNQGNTLLAGVIPDQAALHGILLKIRDLGLHLVSLRRTER